MIYDLNHTESENHYKICIFQYISISKNQHPSHSVIENTLVIVYALYICLTILTHTYTHTHAHTHIYTYIHIYIYIYLAEQQLFIVKKY